MTDSLAQARQFFLDGNTHFEAGRLEEAARCFEAALSLAPGRPSVLTNLGATWLRLGRWADAVPLLEDATRAEPDNLEAWAHLGTALAELGQAEPAADALQRALALDPSQALLWSRRGSLLRELGQLEAAADCFEQALARGADAQLNGYYLAAVRSGDAPSAPPRDYVQALFDRYAHEFQDHLVEDLNYQAHEVLVNGLAALGREHYASVLDLGCGTGLLGPLVRPMAGHIDGVDLSTGMLDGARATGAYRALVHADVTEYLRDAQRQDDLVLAADVFIYVGALEVVFEGVARILAPGGVFAFSVEELAGEPGWRLRPSLRYAHSEAYLRGLAQQHGLSVRSVLRAPIREDQRQPVPGLYLYLARG